MLSPETVLKQWTKQKEWWIFLHDEMGIRVFVRTSKFDVLDHSEGRWFPTFSIGIDAIGPEMTNHIDVFFHSCLTKLFFLWYVSIDSSNIQWFLIHVFRCQFGPFVGGSLEHQVTKSFKNLSWRYRTFFSGYFGGWTFPCISRIHTAYYGEDSSVLGTWNAWNIKFVNPLCFSHFFCGRMVRGHLRKEQRYWPGLVVNQDTCQYPI